MTATPEAAPAFSGKHAAAAKHGELEPVFDGIWFVRGSIKMPVLLPMNISRSMTVVRGKSGELTLFNSMRLTEPGLKKLEALGPVRNVVRIAGFHGRDDGFYRERYKARIYAVKGQTYFRGFNPGSNKNQGFMQADVWLQDGDALPVADATLKVLSSCNPLEGIAILNREGGILITGDSLQNTPEADEFFNLPGKFMAKRIGLLKPYNVGPAWLRFAKPRADDVRSVLDIAFQHLLPAHGNVVIGDAREKYRPAIERSLAGCRS